MAVHVGWVGGAQRLLVATRWVSLRSPSYETAVVPANAGTHSHRQQLLKVSLRRPRHDNIRRGVWVPAFAGTTEVGSSRGILQISFRDLAAQRARGLHRRCPSKAGAGNAGCTLHPRSRVQ